MTRAPHVRADNPAYLPTYKGILTRFMSHVHNREYPKTHEFTAEELAAITPIQVCGWLALQVYGTEDPAPEDNPTLGRSNSLFQYKSAISFFMPKRPWDAISESGNPTKSKEVNCLIRNVRGKEAPGPGKKSRADRPPGASIDDDIYYYAIRRCRDGGGGEMRSCIFLRWEDCRRYVTAAGGESDSDADEEEEKEPPPPPAPLTPAGGGDDDSEYARFARFDDAMRYLLAPSGEEAREVVREAAEALAEKAKAKSAANDDGCPSADGSLRPVAVVGRKRRREKRADEAREARKRRKQNEWIDLCRRLQTKSQRRRSDNFNTAQLSSESMMMMLEGRSTPVHRKIADIQSAHDSYAAAFEHRLQMLEQIIQRPAALAEERVGDTADDKVSSHAELSKAPATLEALWREYDVGVGSRKAAKRFTPAERRRVESIYNSRMVVWGAIERMVRLGHTPTEAMGKIRDVYGEVPNLEVLIQSMRDDEINGGHPDLRVVAQRMQVNEGKGGGMDEDAADSGELSATLSRKPRDLYTLWQEYEYGVDGRKPAKLFTHVERNRIKYEYCRRNIVWRVMKKLLRLGHTPLEAIEKIYSVYGKVSISKIIELMRKDKKDGGNPELQPDKDGKLVDPNATLIPTPRDLETLWQEYESGIGGRKAAKLFTAVERGRVKYAYCRRKVVWRVIERMVQQGSTPQEAMDRIRQVYGAGPVSTITKLMRKDEAKGGHPDLGGDFNGQESEEDSNPGSTEQSEEKQEIEEEGDGMDFFSM